MHSHDISLKANRVLHLITLSFLIILIRVWYLSVIAHDSYEELSKKPQKKTVIEKPNRGTIRDRFNIPLAVNKLQYDVGICYDQIRQIPAIKRTSLSNGNIEKTYPRKDYILSFARMLSSELEMNQQDLEDIIYGKASLFPATIFTIKENISETQFFKLKALERNFPGLIAQRSFKRYYPREKNLGDVVGYVGSMNYHEHDQITFEIEELTHYLSEHERGNIVFLPKGYTSILEIKNRIKELKKQIFQLDEKIGKTGIEAKFEASLKGDYGKKIFEVNTKGSIVRELPGTKKAEPGKRILLNISSELQEFAEALLAENELLRENKFIQLGKNHDFVTPPWIKGGAIVAMIPSTGEVVALASYPRINPNNFTKKSVKSFEIDKELENTRYIESLWDGKTTLEREFYSHATSNFYMEQKKLTYDFFIERILSNVGHAKKSILKILYLSQSFDIQKNLKTLLDLSEQPNVYALIDTLYIKPDGHLPSVFGTSDHLISLIKSSFSHHEPLVKELKGKLDLYFTDVKSNDDKLLILDILKTVAKEHYFDESLQSVFNHLTLSNYRKICQSFLLILDEIYSLSKETFHLNNFKKWREENFKTYLAEKRKEEKEKRSYQRPYIDYLKKEEKKQFAIFFENYKWDLVRIFLFDEPFDQSTLLPYNQVFTKFKKEKISVNSKDYPVLNATDYLMNNLKKFNQSDIIGLLKTIRSFKDLNDRLYGYYPQIKKRKGFQVEKDLAASFYPPQGFGIGRSYAYRQATSLGSIFKIITAYEAIKQNYEKGNYENPKDLNPLTIIDEIQPISLGEKTQVLGFHEDGRKISRQYKGGTLPRSHASLGKVDYVKAFERSSNIYFSLLASDVIQDPNDLSMASLKFGFGNKTGIDLPGEIPGTLPKDLSDNRSGLYAFAIGQHSLIVTPLQTCVMLSSLVNQGEILKPQIVQLCAGTKKEEFSFFHHEDYPYKEYLNRVGIFFPFFIQMKQCEKKSDITLFEKTLYRKLYLPQAIKDYLLEGMYSVVSSPRGSARAELIRYLYQNTKAMHNYLKLKYQLAGKTSSAEFAYHPTLDRECPKILCKDIWFGGVAFKQSETSSACIKKQEPIPEIVVVVYLKFGDFGKEAAPLAAEVVTKWREICQKEGKSSFITY